VIRDAPLDSTAKAVAWALDSRMNGHGECWPSKAQLAGDTGYSARTVDQAVNRLELAGYVTVKRGNGRGHPNHYRLRNPAANDKKPRRKRHVNPAAAAGEVVKKKKEVLRTPLTAAAAASAVTVDAAMLALAQGWLQTH
jgi:DNA-binding transcriptional regulator YhcF (GntR family)